MEGLQFLSARFQQSLFTVDMIHWRDTVVAQGVCFSVLLVHNVERTGDQCESCVSDTGKIELRHQHGEFPFSCPKEIQIFKAFGVTLASCFTRFTGMKRQLGSEKRRAGLFWRIITEHRTATRNSKVIVKRSEVILWSRWRERWSLCKAESLLIRPGAWIAVMW